MSIAKSGQAPAAISATANNAAPIEQYAATATS
jgi:hypothetical protein